MDDEAGDVKEPIEAEIPDGDSFSSFAGQVSPRLTAGMDRSSDFAMACPLMRLVGRRNRTGYRSLCNLQR